MKKFVLFTLLAIVLAVSCTAPITENEPAATELMTVINDAYSCGNCLLAHHTVEYNDDGVYTVFLKNKNGLTFKTSSANLDVLTESVKIFLNCSQVCEQEKTGNE